MTAQSRFLELNLEVAGMTTYSILEAAAWAADGEVAARLVTRAGPEKPTTGAGVPCSITGAGAAWAGASATYSLASAGSGCSKVR